MKYPITEGKYYKIVGATDGTVTDASGNVIVSYTAGEEVTFAAPAGDYVNINPSGNILSNYATISYVDEAVNNIDLSDYATTAQLSNYATTAQLSNYATTAQLSNYATTAQLSNYATITYVDEAVAAAGGSFDMTIYEEFYGKYANCTTKSDFQAINSNYMDDVTNWGEWIYKLPKLTDGYNLFHIDWGTTEKLTSFTMDMPAVTTALQMFEGCTSIVSFIANMPLITATSGMFSGCSNLKAFSTASMSLVTQANYMFYNCSNLTSPWNIDMPNLTTANNMFYGCTNFRSFKGDLSKLTSAQSMFYNCKLDKASVLGLIENIKEKNVATGTVNTTWGIDGSLSNDSEILELLGITGSGQTARITSAGGGTWNIGVDFNS